MDRGQILGVISTLAGGIILVALIFQLNQGTVFQTGVNQYNNVVGSLFS